MKHTVLVVEDEEDLREMMRDALELNGYQVVVAQDGVAALESLPKIDHVCLILLDLLMPRMNGWDFFDAVRAIPQFLQTPVVIHSSVSSRAPAGATRVLTKPADLKRLMAVVKEYCAQ